MDDIWWDKWQSMDSNPGDPWSMVVQEEFGVDSVEMILQWLPNISKHPISRCGRTPRQPHSTHCIPVTVRFCDVLRCCFARVSAHRIFILPEVNRRKIAKTQFCYCEVLLWSLKRFHPWFFFAHPEFTETAVADRWNQSFECLCAAHVSHRHASGHQTTRPRFGLCPTELESATAAGHVD